MRNNSVNSFRIWASCSGDVVLKDFLSGVRAAPCSMEQNLKCKFERGHNEHSCADFGPVVQEEMLFKDIFYLER